MNINRINEQRELLNYEYFHLYNLARHGGKSTLLPRSREIRNSEEDREEYGLSITDNGKKRVWRFPSLERCQQEQSLRPGSSIIRLGRNWNSRRNYTQRVDSDSDTSTISFLAHADESGNIETPEFSQDVEQSTSQLVSFDLNNLGFIKGSGCRPSSQILRDLAMRYNDIVPEEFASAVLKHCEKPRPGGESDSSQGKSPWKTQEEKQAWYDTPAGQAWVKENPTPSIFGLPTPEILKHRRDNEH